MPRYTAEWTDGTIKFDVDFHVDDRGVITEFQPEGLKTRLYGAAYIAHVNFQNLLKGCLMRIPTSISVKATVFQGDGEKPN